MTRGKGPLLLPRQAIVLRWWRKGYSSEQLGQLLNIRPTAARMIVCRALQRLRDRGIDVDDWLGADELHDRD